MVEVPVHATVHPDNDITVALQVLKALFPCIFLGHIAQPLTDHPGNLAFPPDRAEMVPSTALLVISGYLNNESRRSREDMGIEHVLSKPAGMSDLLMAVGEALDPNGAAAFSEADSIPND
ncbi:TPA: hypothetical protein DCE37_18235 [Candidatus Latescibacteria bacterium]|nr:hypothetical protein [Candidatus Latescibacterota bacterium]